MEPSVISFQPNFIARVKEVQKVAIFVRGREIQESAVSKLEDLIVEIQALKQSSIDLGDEDNANGRMGKPLMFSPFKHCPKLRKPLKVRPSAGFFKLGHRSKT